MAKFVLPDRTHTGNSTYTLAVTDDISKYYNDNLQDDLKNYLDNNYEGYIERYLQDHAQSVASTAASNIHRLTNLNSNFSESYYIMADQGLYASGYVTFNTVYNYYRSYYDNGDYATNCRILYTSYLNIQHADDDVNIFTVSASAAGMRYMKGYAVGYQDGSFGGTGNYSPILHNTSNYSWGDYTSMSFAMDYKAKGNGVYFLIWGRL